MVPMAWTLQRLMRLFVLASHFSLYMLVRSPFYHRDGDGGHENCSIIGYYEYDSTSSLFVEEFVILGPIFFGGRGRYVLHSCGDGN
jgi:hypothetical protein